MAALSIVFVIAIGALVVGVYIFRQNERIGLLIFGAGMCGILYSIYSATLKFTCPQGGCPLIAWDMPGIVRLVVMIILILLSVVVSYNLQKILREQQKKRSN